MVVQRGARYNTVEYGDAVYTAEAKTNRARPVGAFSVQTDIYRADRYGRLVERIPTRYPVQGAISFNENTKVKRSLSLTVNDPHVFQAYNDFLVPVVTLTDASGEAETRKMGHFVTLQPSSELTPGRYSGSIEAKGIEYLLQLDTIGGGLSVPAGTDTGAAARAVAEESGFNPSQIAIPDTGYLLPEEKYIEPGMTRLDAINELLNAGGWYAVWSNGDGVIRTGPWQDLVTAMASTRYSTHEGRIRVVGSVKEAPDATRLANRITVRNIAPEQVPIFGTKEVTNRDHPLHRDRIGVVIAETIDDPDVKTTEDAEARASSILSERASYYRKQTVTTVIDLSADAHEIIDLDIQDENADVAGRWWRQAWSVHLQGAHGLTVHELNRVEAWQ